MFLNTEIKKEINKEKTKVKDKINLGLGETGYELISISPNFSAA